MINLSARLSLNGNQYLNSLRRITRATQQANRQTNLWRDSNGYLRNSLGQFARQADRSTNSISNFGRAMTSPIRAVGSLTSGLTGLVGAFAAAAGAKKAFESTVGAAAKYEQSSVVIEAMFRDTKKASQYMKAMNNLAIDSPLLNSQDIFSNSKSFIAFSQDIDTLEKMFKLAERFIAISPEQGVEGAVFSMKELFSGKFLPFVLAIVRRISSNSVNPLT